MHLVGIYGAGGCGRVVMSLLRKGPTKDDTQFVFIDDVAAAVPMNGCPVLTFGEFVHAQADIKSFTVAVADPHIRESLTQKCLLAGLSWFEHVSSGALVLADVRFGAGVFLSPFATVGCNSSIGKGFFGDLYSCVNHDCTVGDWVTLAPYANINGNVTVGDNAYIGSGAVIRQGRRGQPLMIGAGAMIGMGAVVTKNVPAGAVVVGNPARPYQKA